MTKRIPLTQGYVTFVDDEDYALVSQFSWRAMRRSNTVYAICHIPQEGGGQTTQRMHRLILGLSDPKTIADHKDWNGLNNQKTEPPHSYKGTEQCLPEKE